LNQKLVTILIPNYKTPEITKICLRLIRQHTDFTRAEVIVIDNNSNDASLEYLKTLNWITLIERKADAPETPPLSHSRALDLALTQVKTPYVLSIHTDTFVKRADWLDVLLTPFDKNPKLAGVGSWKLESKSRLQMLGYQFEQAWKNCYLIILAIPVTVQIGWMSTPVICAVTVPCIAWMSFTSYILVF